MGRFRWRKFYCSHALVDGNYRSWIRQKMLGVLLIGFTRTVSVAKKNGGKCEVSTGLCMATVWQQAATVHLPASLPNDDRFS